jgi:ABC-type bacteriocin/lantibiotic exporter with double-glycine peptidase domain
VLLAIFIQFITSPNPSDFSLIITYVVVGFRLLPSLIKIQNAFTTLRILEPNVLRLIDLNKKLVSTDEPDKNIQEELALERADSASTTTIDFVPSLSVQGLEYTFEDSIKSIFMELTLEVIPYEYLGLTGISGSGKSTLVEICLGLRTPTSGKVQLGGLDPEVAFNYWKSQISYFSQNTYLFDGTLAENIALGHSTSEIDHLKISSLIESLKLDDLSNNRTSNTEILIGDNGDSLSGGQRQRVGLARALYPDPKFLILDEATSSQDTHTEDFLVEYIRTLKGKMTIISISHNPNSLKYCDRVIDMSALINGNQEN